MASLPYYIGGLMNPRNYLPGQNPVKSETSPYDVIIRLNSLTSLSTSGWEIVLGDRTTNLAPSSPSTVKTDPSVIVSILGPHNRGKSFLLNQLCGINLPSRNLIHTEGISITTGKDAARDIIFIDIAGTDTVIPKNELDDKKATETLLREIALHLCSFVIIVVNHLRVTDQSYIREMVNSTKNTHPRKNILIVHNLMDIETKKDMDDVIDKEIKQFFDAKPDKMNLSISQKSINVDFFRSTDNGVKLQHFIMAKQGSKAAQIWNQQSMDAILMILQAAMDARRNLNVIQEIIDFVNTKLPQLFINNQKHDCNATESHQQMFQVQQHATQPFIVLAHRREMEDLSQDPTPFIVYPKLIYDNTGYSMGISSMTTGQWQPLYSLYETNEEIHVIVELTGFKKGEIRIEVIEQAIIIEGGRADFKEGLCDPDIQQEKIPIGSFRLEIPLKSKVNPDATKLERDEGFYKITCPKKRHVTTYLE